MKSYNVGGFTLTVLGSGTVVAKSHETEQRLTREQAAKILKKAHTEHKIRK